MMPHRKHCIVARQESLYTPDVWLIDVERETVTQYTQPDGTRYDREQTLVRGQRIVSDIVSYLHLSIDGILG